MSSLTVTAVAAGLFISAVAGVDSAAAQPQRLKQCGPEQKACHKGGGSAHCNHCIKVNKHWRHPPSAPLLASTPALMSPLILAPTQPLVPRRPELDAELLRELLGLLRGAQPRSGAAESPGQKDQGPDNRAARLPRPAESAADRIERIDRQLSKIEQDLHSIGNEAARSIKNLHERLKKMEAR